MNPLLFQVLLSLPGLIASVEALKPGKGTVKKAAVRKIVMESTIVADLLTDLNVKDKKKFQQGLDSIIDGIVAVLNSTEWKKS